MRRRRISVLIGSALSMAVIGYAVVLAMRELQFAHDLRQKGVQTGAVVTKFGFHHCVWGTQVYDIEYDYVAGGSTRHNGAHVVRKPATYEGEHIAVTYLRDRPESSLPFAKHDIDWRVFHDFWTERIFPYSMILIVVAIIIIARQMVKRRHSAR